MFKIGDKSSHARALLLAVFLFIFSCSESCHARQNPVKDNRSPSAAQEVFAIAALLKQHHIDRVVEFNLPEDIETVIDVTPGRLETSEHSYEIEQRDFSGTPEESRYIEALKQTRCANALLQARDFRWGCVFYREQHRVASIFLTYGGEGADVNGVLATVNGPLYNLVKSDFSGFALRHFPGFRR